MALKTSTIALTVAFFGALSFLLGVIAENKKPAAGIPIPGNGVVICKFPSDATVALGSLSFLALLFSTAVGLFSIFYSYKGESVPRDALFQSTTLIVFLGISVGVSVIGGVLMLWATIQESLHQVNNVHQGLDYQCPTAKTGLFGGAAFLCLDASLFWLVCQMLTLNARSDYLEDDDPKGEYGQVLATEYDTSTRGAKV